MLRVWPRRGFPLAIARGHAAIALACLALAACGQPAPAPPPATATAAVAPPAAAPAVHTHDLSIDESMGGHTLAKHVGRTDDELRARLRQERDISSASSYTDRATAERVVDQALTSGGRQLDAWRARSGRRPNLVLSYTDRSGNAIGWSISRGQSTAVSCVRALVVLAWDDRRGREFVLTSYPEAGR
jgi:hypothetical protein